jgi:hypothetical protein
MIDSFVSVGYLDRVVGRLTVLQARITIINADSVRFGIQGICLQKSHEIHVKRSANPHEFTSSAYLTLVDRFEQFDVVVSVQNVMLTDEQQIKQNRKQSQAQFAQISGYIVPIVCPLNE